MRSKCTESLGCSVLAIGTGLSMVMLLSSCMTLEKMAPPVTGELRMMANRSQMDPAILELGREVYLSDCARCHGVEPIGRYSAQQWRKILPDMVRQTKLNEQRADAVTAYVTLARARMVESSR